MNSPKRLDIYYARLEEKIGSVQYGHRPVVIVQNDIGNYFAQSVIVVPMTSQLKKELPTHVSVGIGGGVKEESIILCEQITTISTLQLDEKIGRIRSRKVIRELDAALAVAIGLDKNYSFDEKKLHPVIPDKNR